jgi:hypothetical protein
LLEYENFTDVLIQNMSDSELYEAMTEILNSDTTYEELKRIPQRYIYKFIDKFNEKPYVVLSDKQINSIRSVVSNIEEIEEIEDNEIHIRIFNTVLLRNVNGKVDHNLIEYIFSKGINTKLYIKGEPLFVSLFDYQNIHLTVQLLDSGVNLNCEWEKSKVSESLFISIIKKMGVRYYMSKTHILLHFNALFTHSKYKIDINKKDSNGSSAIMCENNMNIIKLLIKYGADINSINNKGENILFRYQSSECVSELRELIEVYGANPNVINSKGKTIKDIHLKKKNYDVVQYLEMNNYIFLGR